MRFLLLLLLAVQAQAQVALHELTRLEPAQGAHFGASVSGVPDVDGDGVTDLLVSDPDQFPDPSVRVYSGANGVLLYKVRQLSASPDFRYPTAVAGLEDVDGDGYGDFLVGDPEYSDSEYAEGRAYVFSGATGVHLRTIPPPSAWNNGRFGNAVAGVPDVDGDGVTDLLIGAPGVGHSFGDPGRAYVFSGASGILLYTLAAPDPTLWGEFGIAASAVPDIDGDGVAEFLVGEPGSAVPGHFGRIHLFSGATGERLYGIDSPNPEAAGHFGAAVRGTGDVDGDGRGDLLVGAPGESPEGSPDEAGRAYVFSGATGALLHELASPNEEARGVFGAAVSVVPNVNGSDHPGLLVGAARSHIEPEGEGRAYLFDGATGALLETVLPPDGPSPGSFGHALAGLRDVDGDGFGDILVGAPNDPFGGVHEAGRAYYSGTPDASPSVVVEAEPLDSPVPRGDTLRVAVTVTNPGAHAATFDLRFAALAYEGDLDGSFTLTDLAYTDTFATGLALAPGEKMSYAGTTVALPPSGIPAGYMGRVLATRSEGGTLGVDAFAFEVTSGLVLSITAEPLNSPVPRGDTLRIATTITNPTPRNLDIEVRFHASGDVDLQASFGTLALAPGETASLLGSVPVPEDVEPGEYPGVVEAVRLVGERAGVTALLFEIAAGVGVEAGAPSAFAFHPPRPNPSPGRMLLALDLPSTSPVRLTVLDVLGREVALLAEGLWEAGRHEVALEAGTLAPGAYAVRAEVGEVTAVRFVTISR